MSFNNEHTFEDNLIEQLTKIDNQWSKNVLNFKNENDLIDNWADILFKNNNTLDRLNNCPLTSGEKKQLISYINGLRTPYEINKLLNSNYIPLKRDNQNDKLHYGKYVYLFIFDKDDIAAGQSTYQIARQPKFYTSSEILGQRRGDLMLLINGLPLIHIELKRSGIPITQACNQISKYLKHGVFTGLFSFVQIFVAMNPEETVYFANNGIDIPLNPDYFFHWADFTNNHINDWKDIASTLLSIPMAHRLVGYGTIADDGDKLLKVMRSYQYHAAYKVYTRVLGRQDWDAPDQKGGYIYHTTGSGKTLTSFKCAQLIKSSQKVDKIIFLMDRTELWKQTALKYKNFADSDEIDETPNTNSLLSKICSDEKAQLIVTSIQKMSLLTYDSTNRAFVNRLNKISNKKIVFIVDEAHRSTFGTMLSNIKLTYKNAMFFGFTGTPIKEVNSINKITTEGLFGNLLHQYTILEGIRDRNVLGFKTFKISTFDEYDLKCKIAAKKVGASFNEQQTYDPEQIKKFQDWINKPMIDIEREYSTTLYSCGITAKKHRANVIENILNQWNTTSCFRKFHHILATSSIKEAIEYYELLKNNRLGLNVTAVFDPHSDNTTDDTFKDEAVAKILSDYNENFGFHYTMATYKDFKDDVCSRLAHLKPYEDLDEHNDEKIDIVIVVNQLLTGFDSKWINTIYLDKILEYEQFIQAASRTNRLFGPEKPYGVIKYYRKPYTMDENANNALKLYAEHGYENVFASSLGLNLTNINKSFEEIRKIFRKWNILNFSKLPDDEQDKKCFASLFNNLNYYIECAIPELFSWQISEYDAEDFGHIKIEIDQLTFNILKLRYSELVKESSTNDEIIYDIKPYLTEISSQEIDRAYMESKFHEFIKDLSNGTSKDKINDILDELKSKFAILSKEDQQTADRILEDILSGSLTYQEGKTFIDYIQIYNQNMLIKNVETFSNAFGINQTLLLRITRLHLKEENLHKYGRFEKIISTIDVEKAKKSIEKIEHQSIKPYRIIQKAETYIKKFILSAGLDIPAEINN